MPKNEQPVEPFGEERHLDLQSDIHFFFDLLVTDKTVLDVGAGFGKSKARMRHQREVTTHDISPHVRDRVDGCAPMPPDKTFDVVTAFDVIEHVEDDALFLDLLDTRARQAIFLSTPNWYIHRCQSRHHYREYTNEEFCALLHRQWPDADFIWGAFYKDAEGGWCEVLSEERFLFHRGIKHLTLVSLSLSAVELIRIRAMFSERGEWAAL